MNLGGELVSLLVSLVQEIGVVVGVGALTLTLIAHLLSLHAHRNETTRSYVRAAHYLRAMALVVIVLSGAAAVLIHAAGGAWAILVSPAFIFKWLLVVLLVVLHFTEWRVEGVAQDATEGFEGANWYALFIVHTLAPVVSWTFLLALYTGWLITFGIIWAIFVWIMRAQSTIKPKTPKEPTGKPPAVVQKPVPPSQPKPVAQPAPAVQKHIEVHPNHTLLPMVAELKLPVPQPRVPAPKPTAPEPKHAAPAPLPPKPVPAPVPTPPAPAPAPKPSAVEIVPESSQPPVPMPTLNESGLPALHVMPRRPEDIESSKRGPVVKMSED